MKSIEGWSKILSKSVQLTFTRAKKKSFVLEIILLYMEKCMCEEIGKDSGSMGHKHVCIHIVTCMLI